MALECSQNLGFPVECSLPPRPMPNILNATGERAREKEASTVFPLPTITPHPPRPTLVLRTDPLS